MSLGAAEVGVGKSKQAINTGHQRAPRGCSGAQWTIQSSM